MYWVMSQVSLMYLIRLMSKIRVMCQMNHVQGRFCHRQELFSTVKHALCCVTFTMASLVCKGCRI